MSDGLNLDSLVPLLDVVALSVTPVGDDQLIDVGVRVGVDRQPPPSLQPLGDDPVVLFLALRVVEAPEVEVVAVEADHGLSGRLVQAAFGDALIWHGAVSVGEVVVLPLFARV